MWHERRSAGQYKTGNKGQLLDPSGAAGHSSGMLKAISAMGNGPACSGQQPSLHNSYRASALQLDMVPTMGHLQTLQCPFIFWYTGSDNKKKYHLAQQMPSNFSQDWDIISVSCLWSDQMLNGPSVTVQWEVKEVLSLYLKISMNLVFSWTCTIFVSKNPCDKISQVDQCLAKP